MIENFDIVRILGIGTIGLGFLLAFFAFRLLNKEQNETQPRDGILRAINRFMLFSFSLCIIGFSSEIYRQDNSSLQLGCVTGLSHEELPSARNVAEKFLSELDQSNYQDAYDGTPRDVKKYLTFNDFKNQAVNMSSILGQLRARKFYLAQKGPGQTPNGVSTLYYITFVSSYEKNINIAELVTLLKTEIGFKVVNYVKN